MKFLVCCLLFVFCTGCACHNYQAQTGIVVNPTNHDVTIAFYGDCDYAYVFVPKGSYKEISLGRGHYNLVCTQQKKATATAGRITGLSGRDKLYIDKTENDTLLDVGLLLGDDELTEPIITSWVYPYHGGVYPIPRYLRR